MYVFLLNLLQQLINLTTYHIPTVKVNQWCWSNFFITYAASMSMSEDISNFLTKPEIVNMKWEVMRFLEHVQLFYVEAATQHFPLTTQLSSLLFF